MLRKIYFNLEEILASAVLVAMCGVAVLQVASRYILNAPFSWTEEVCTILFVWLVFISASLALKKKSHFSVDILADKLPSRISAMVRFSAALMVFLFSVMLIIFGIRFVMVGWHSITPAIEIRKSFTYAAVPIGGLLMIIRTVEAMIYMVKEGRR